MYGDGAVATMKPGGMTGPGMRCPRCIGTITPGGCISIGGGTGPIGRGIMSCGPIGVGTSTGGGIA